MKEKQQVEFESFFRTFMVTKKVRFISGNLRLDKWISSVIIKSLGDLYYEINYFGNFCKGHSDKILNCEPGVQTAKVPVRNRITMVYYTMLITFYVPVAETLVSHPEAEI